MSDNTLYAVRDDGTGLRVLHERDVGETVAYAPNGKLVAYGCSASGQPPISRTAVCIGDFLTGGERRVSLIDLVPDSYLETDGITWSPSSDRLAFVVVQRIEGESGAVERAYGGLFVHDLQTNESTLIDRGGPGSYLAQVGWSPDGQYLAAQRAMATAEEPAVLELFRADGSALTIGLGERSAGGFDWSPDSQWLALEAYNESALFLVRPEADPTPRRVQLASGNPLWTPASTMFVEEGDTRGFSLFGLDDERFRLVPHGLATARPIAFSNAGQLAFVGSAMPAAGQEASSSMGVYSAWLLGEGPIRLTGNQSLGFLPLIAWSPDGVKIFYTAEGSECRIDCPPGRLFMVKADGTGEPINVSDDVTVTEIIGWVER